MKILIALTLCCTAASAAPQNLNLSPAGGIWNIHTSILDEFEANLARMRDEFDQLEKSLESRFKFPTIDQTDVGILEDGNGTSIFNIVDPSKVKNESFSDTKIVDGKVVHTEEKVIANGNSVVHFKKVEITPKDGVRSSTDDDEQPNKTSKTPAADVPAVTPSKNDVDSEHVDIEEGSNRPRDVEEIDSVRPSAGSSHFTPQSRVPQKQIFLL